MATHFSANQYEQAFAAQRLQNWQLPQKFKERPSALDGFTQTIANDRGHLLAGVPRSKASPWGEFVGTWDMKKPPLRARTMKTKAAQQEVKPDKVCTPSPQETKAASPQVVKTPSPEPPGVRMASPVAMTARTPSPRARNPSPPIHNPASRTPSPLKTPNKADSPCEMARSPNPQKTASPLKQVEVA